MGFNTGMYGRPVWRPGETPPRTPNPRGEAWHPEIPLPSLSEVLASINELCDPASPDRQDFIDGYEYGAYLALEERDTGTKSTEKKPTWYGRGVVRGHADRISGAALERGADLMSLLLTLMEVREKWPKDMPRPVQPRSVPT